MSLIPHFIVCRDLERRINEHVKKEPITYCLRFQSIKPISWFFKSCHVNM